MKKLCGCLLLVLVSVPIAAEADEPRVRTFGASVGLSGGFFTVVGPFGSGGGVDVTPLDIELEVPLGRELSLQLWVPLATLLVANLGDEEDAFLWTSFFFKWSPGEGQGPFLSPGLGVMVSIVDGSGAAGPEISARIGYEASSDSRGFGFTVGFRPFVDVLFGSGGKGAAFGTLFEMGFHFYGTRARPVSVQ